MTKSPAFNGNGQQTDDGVNYTYKWDAFGRMTEVKSNGGGTPQVVEYKYNGLNMVIGRHADLNASGTVTTSDKWEWFIYDPRWRHVATMMVAGTAFSASADTYVKEQYYYHNAGRGGRGSSSYIDSVILRDRDDTNGLNGSTDATMEHRVYYCQNWRADVSVTMTEAGRILEWIKYSAYGVAQRTSAAEYNHDGGVDSFDDSDFATDYAVTPTPPTAADINFDGTVDSSDNTMWAATFADGYDTSRGELAQTTTNARYNRLGYAGYWLEPAGQQYLVRNRELDPLVGVWDERDPIGYHDGADLYSYVNAHVVIQKDPTGLVRSACLSGGCGMATLASPLGLPGDAYCILAVSACEMSDEYKHRFDEVYRLIATRCGANVDIRTLITCEDTPETCSGRCGRAVAECDNGKGSVSLKLCSKPSCWTNKRDFCEAALEELLHISQFCRDGYFPNCTGFSITADGCLDRELEAKAFSNQCDPIPAKLAEICNDRNFCLCALACGSCANNYPKDFPGDAAGERLVACLRKCKPKKPFNCPGLPI
ncbi:MAG: RHS repeat-associated core domain-containing protein [Planctomycetota bacterium]